MTESVLSLKEKNTLYKCSYFWIGRKCNTYFM